MKIKKLCCYIAVFYFLFGSLNAYAVNKLYKKIINNIIDNNQCSNQDFYLNIPRQISDDEMGQYYSTQFSNNVFVDFLKKENKVTSVDISITPLPQMLDEQLPAFCIISAIQAAMDKSRSQDEYMKLDSKLYRSALKNGKFNYQSKSYEHSSFLLASTTLIYRIEVIN